MSLEDYQIAVELMERHKSLQQFVGPRPRSLVKLAEEYLGVHFPESYQRFLVDYGAGNFGSSEIYGVIHENFETSGVPDVVWYNKGLRNRLGLPKNIIIIYEVGDGELVGLNLDDTTSLESPVVKLGLGQSLERGELEPIASDFGAFFLRLVQEQVSSLGR